VAANLADFPGELVEADLRDAGAVASAMQGAGAVHVAADYRLWARNPGNPGQQSGHDAR
jgi:dihydroflavonol-4-reductase